MYLILDRAIDSIINPKQINFLLSRRFICFALVFAQFLYPEYRANTHEQEKSLKIACVQCCSSSLLINARRRCYYEIKVNKPLDEGVNRVDRDTPKPTKRERYWNW